MVLKAKFLNSRLCQSQKAQNVLQKNFVKTATSAADASSNKH